jgi:uncharacterized protein involved in response to NO
MAETWGVLSSQPHRLMFFCGALQALAAMLWWLCDLSGRYAGWHAPIAWSVPPMWAHAWLLLYGFFPFFMFGFLMTAAPNWLGAPVPTRRVFVPAALMMVAGLALFYAGLATRREVVAAGAILHLAGWLWGAAALIRMAAGHWGAQARYALLIFGFFAVGVCGDAVFALALATGDYTYAPYALHGAVWFFLLPVFLGVTTRMVPFFSKGILGPQVDYKPGWARPALVAGALTHGVLQLGGAEHLLWLIDLPIAIAIALLAWKWGLTKSAGTRLLAVLHWSLAVLALAFLLSGALSLAVAAGTRPRIGLAPLHLLVVGYFATTVLGMVSRVSLGHSGRALKADTLTWTCYLGVLLSAALRAAAEFLPGSSSSSALMMAAALAWLAAFGVWAARYVPMYLAPRVDR